MHPPVQLVAIDVDGTLLPAVGGRPSRRTELALSAAAAAGIQVVIATGRRMAYTTPLLTGCNLPGHLPIITSNGAVVRTLSGDLIDRCHMPASVARTLCGLLRGFGALVFTFDRPGRSEMVLEDLEQATGRIALWIENNRHSIQVVQPLESALTDDEDPIQGMVAGTIEQMRRAELALQNSPWAAHCASVKTEYPARNLSILDLLPVGVSKGAALQQLAASRSIDRRAVAAIGDNWNDFDMLSWAGQPWLMGNASPELRAHALRLGWRQAPANDQDGVAVVLERIVANQSRLRES